MGIIDDRIYVLLGDVTLNDFNDTHIISPWQCLL